MLCPNCDTTSSPLYLINRFQPALDIYRCKACGLQMQNIDKKINLVKLYEKDYYTGNSNYTYYDERKFLKFNEYVWQARLKRISKFVPAPADFLDVGCAFGGFALAAKRFGYRSQGIDVSSYAIKHAKTEGLSVQQGSIDEPLKQIYSKNSFDVVTLIEVFEHLSHPLQALKNLKEIVRPGGLVLIQTANFLGWQARLYGSSYHYYLPGHLYYYNTKNLRSLFQKYGFSKVYFFRGVDFGLWPKIKKMKGYLGSSTPLLRLMKMCSYHMISKIAYKDFSLSSSMVMYAIKDETINKTNKI